MDMYNEDDDPFKLPFEDIDIAKLKVKQVPDMEVIQSDGMEQKHRQNAVDKLEKSYMADAALKKAKEKEKEDRQKRLDEQAQAKAAAELAKEEKEFDLLKQGGVIRQKKSDNELKQEWAALSAEEKEERKKASRERGGYTGDKKNTRPKLLEPLARGIEEETVMVEVKMDDYELIPIEKTDIGKELAASTNNLQQIEAMDVISSDVEEVGGMDGKVIDKRQEMIFNMNTKQLYEYLLEQTGLGEQVLCKVFENGFTGEMVEIALVDDDLICSWFFCCSFSFVI